MPPLTGLAAGRGDLAPAGTVIGRARALHAISAAIAGLADQAGAGLVLTGEPGIGKTALLRIAAEQAAAAGALVACGHGSGDSGAPALWPWVQVLRAVRDVLGDPVPATQGTPLLAHSGFPLRDAAAAVLMAAARRVPVVILLDDLHLADSESLAMAEHLAALTGGAPLCFIGAMRDTGAVPGVAGRPEALHTVSLGALSPDECRELAHRRIGGFLTTKQLQRLFARTGGNPLFVEAVLSGDTGPTSPVRTLILEWLGSLAPAQRAVLHAACQVQTAVSSVALAQVSRTSTSAVGSLVRAQLLVAGFHGQVTLRHGLIAEVLSERIDPAQRIDLHRAWADALSADPLLVTQHLEIISAQLLSALPATDPAEARSWAVRAAVNAGERRSYTEQATWYRRALATIGPDGSGRSDLLLGLGRALLDGGDPVRAAAALEASVSAADRAGDGVGKLDAWVWLAETRRRMPGTDADEPTRVALMATADALPDVPPRLLARAAEQVARMEALRGTDVRAAEVAERARAAVLRSTDAEAVAAADRATRWACTGPCALAAKRAASSRLPRVGDADRWLRHRWQLVDALEHGDRTLVDFALQRCRKLAMRRSEPFQASLTTSAHVAVALLDGRFDDAQRLITDGLEAALRHGIDTGPLHAQLAYLAWERGETGTCLALVRALSDVDRPPLAHAVLAGVLSQTGNAADAATELERLAVDGFRHVPRNAAWLQTMSWCATACARLGRADIAGPLRDLLLPVSDRGVVAGGGHPALFLGAVRHFTGLLAVSLGEPEAALDDLGAALSFHRRLRARPWAARTLFEQGRAYLARDRAADADRAGAAFMAAGAEADAVGMAALAAACRDHADQRPVPGGTLVRRDTGWEVAFSAAPFHLLDGKGLRCLHHLLGRPGETVLAVELVSSVLGERPANAERARVNVTRQLRTAVDRIAEHDPALAAHLRASLTTGRRCGYAPAGPTPAWRLG